MVTRRTKLPRLTPIKIVSALFVALLICSLLAASVGDFMLNRQANPDSDGATNFESAGEFEESLRDQIRKDPTDAPAMANLANFLANSGRRDEAIDLYEQALAVDPKANQVRLDFAATLANAGKRNDAEVQYKRVIELDPRSAEGHYYLADLYRQWEPSRRSEAIALYQRTIELAPDAFLAQQSSEELARLGAGGATPDAPATATAGT